MDIICDKCKMDILEPGALVFSPPHGRHTEKFHICLWCWLALYEWMGIVEEPSVNSD